MSGETAYSSRRLKRFEGRRGWAGAEVVLAVGSETGAGGGGEVATLVVDGSGGLEAVRTGKLQAVMTGSAAGSGGIEALNCKAEWVAASS